MSTSLRAALLFSLNIFLWVTYSKESLIQEGLNRYKFASLICNCKEITASPNWKRLLFEPRLLMKWTRYVCIYIFPKLIISMMHHFFLWRLFLYIYINYYKSLLVWIMTWVYKMNYIAKLTIKSWNITPQSKSVTKVSFLAS